MKQKATIIGHFGIGKELINGQTIKTKSVADALENQYGKELIGTIDTHGGFKQIPKMIFQICEAAKNCSNLIILPAQNGIRILVPLCLLVKKIYRVSVHYVVIGGWLPSYLSRKKLLRFLLKKYNGIYVETNTMKMALESQGFTNSVLMVNFKNQKIVAKDTKNALNVECIRFCTYSRVMKEKGIQDAINVISKLNNTTGYNAILDIYGPIEVGQEQWFFDLMKGTPDYIEYRGEIAISDSVDTLRQYDLLLFPTRFYTEGVPGTIIDAYSAGLPVIASKWESFNDVIDDGITGWGYEFNNNDSFLNVIEQVIKYDSDKFNIIIGNCINKAYMYVPQNSIKVLVEKLS